MISTILLRLKKSDTFTYKNDTEFVMCICCELQMGIFLHYLAMFVAGICVSLSALWQITLVTFSVLPIIAVTGGIYITYKTTQASQSQEAYMMASVVAEEVSYIVY